MKKIALGTALVALSPVAAFAQVDPLATTLSTSVGSGFADITSMLATNGPILLTIVVGFVLLGVAIKLTGFGKRG